VRKALKSIEEEKVIEREREREGKTVVVYFLTF
jgi:DNA-binding MarR family transcriptional regulator